MSSTEHKTAQSRVKPQSPAGDDAMLPFSVESLSARGRAVQLGAALDTLISRHNYPEPVAMLLAEAATLTALLGSSLKFKGKFTLQTQTDGAVSLLVCDYGAPGEENAPASLRAYARYDAEKLAALQAGGGAPAQAALLGNGTLALTLDQGADMQLYQGIVALEHMSLQQAAEQYFARSEQIPTKICLSAARLSCRGSDGALRQQWRGGGLLVQHLPAAGGAVQHLPATGGAGQKAETANAQSEEDKWREMEFLTETVQAEELTDPLLPAEQLLYRLFHSHGARVFPPQRLVERCTCSREKLRAVLAGFPAQERAQGMENGKITAKCEFCSAVYEFTEADFAAKAEKHSTAKD